MTSARPAPGLVADGAAVLVRGSPDPEHDCPATGALPVGMLSSHDRYAGLGAINRSRAALLGFEGFGLAFTRT